MRWCVPKHKFANANFRVFGSYISTSRPAVLSGNSFAEGLLLPALQNAGSGAGRSKGDTHTGRISVIATNEPATLANLTNAVARQDGGVTNLKIVNRQQDFVEILVDVEVRDLRHLSMVIAGLRAVSGLTQVERAYT